ncbi:YheC/YheD family protein [Paenibacillus spongiae]|uniref:YheC/YheD family protein n=1 Tax=Paenibacillus spongiae TaxID=2909671 RepID=A0ABY5SCC8_9BACL|nr:YheC/YheD family protein [Paenibacillus spongiae]UVI30333.1 YheC/YheD family protein [Paenibacillus spongiae]
MAIQRVQSKWAKTNVLLQSDSISGSIPSTRRWSKETLRQMLNEYAMVYVKPDAGTFGIGVIRVEKRPNDVYTFQHGTNLRIFSSFETMADQLQRLIGSRTYLIQRGIHLLRHSKRRFDIRVMVQKNPSNRWETTGIIGRLGNPAKIVTNYHSGGTPMAIERLMATHLSAADIPAYKNRLRKLGTDVAIQLESRYPRLKEIGIDVAIDTSFKPWILEVNTLPDPYIFRKLRDKSVFQRVYRYCVAYGRYKRKRH